MSIRVVIVCPWEILDLRNTCVVCAYEYSVGRMSLPDGRYLVADCMSIGCGQRSGSEKTDKIYNLAYGALAAFFVYCSKIVRMSSKSMERGLGKWYQMHT